MARSIIKWFGGKSRFVNKIIPIIHQVNHEIFVDCFGGGGNMILNKSPSRCEIYNDIDGGLVNFFRVLSNQQTFNMFRDKLFLTPYSREEFEYCIENYSEETDPIERARMFFVKHRQSFGGLGKCWAVSKTPTNNGDLDVAAWLSSVDYLPDVAQRFRQVKIENRNFEDIFKLYDTENTLFYCDPPYVQDVRSKAQYENDFNNQQHEKLVELLLNMKGMCLLSGYENDIYKKLEEAGWGVLKFDVHAMSFANTGSQNISQGERKPVNDKFKRVECLWVDPKTRKKILI